MALSTSNFWCQAAETAGVATLVVGGDVDIATAPAFREALLARVPQATRGGLIVDLTRVRLMDSEGLRALLAAREALHERLVLVGIGTTLQRLFDIIGANRLFLMLADAEAAAAHLAARWRARA